MGRSLGKVKFKGSLQRGKVQVGSNGEWGKKMLGGVAEGSQRAGEKTGGAKH